MSILPNPNPPVQPRAMSPAGDTRTRVLFVAGRLPDPHAPGADDEWGAPFRPEARR